MADARRFRLRATVLSGAALLLASCGGRHPAATAVERPHTLSVSASADANPAPSGKGAPVVVRVYQLTSSAGFERAEFFRLLNQDAATLGPDLVKREEFLVAPGATKTEPLSLADTAQAVGIFAAYRDFQHADWRAVAQVVPHKTVSVVVTAAAKGVTVAAAGP